MSDLIDPLAAASISESASNHRPRGTQPYDSILAPTGVRKIIFDPGEAYCRVAHYTDNSGGNWEFTCDGRKHNNRGLRQHLFEPRGSHRRMGEVMGILRPEQRHFHGPSTPCILYPPTQLRQPPSHQQQRQHSQLAHHSPPYQGLDNAQPGRQPFVQQQQQQAQPSYAPPQTQNASLASLGGQQPSQQPEQQKHIQQPQLIRHQALNQVLNRAIFANQPPSHQQQQKQQDHFGHAPFFGHLTQQQQQQQHQQYQYSQLANDSALSQSYHHGHVSGQSSSQQHQQLNQVQHVETVGGPSTFVPYPAPLISQDLYDLAWAAKLRSEQQQMMTIQSGARSHDFGIVTDGLPLPSPERWTPFAQRNMTEALDEAPTAADAATEADAATSRNRDGSAQACVWIGAPDEVRILKCFWKRGELYVQPQDDYMFYGYGRWKGHEEVPVSMEVGTVICGCFRRDGELWVQEDPAGKYRRYGFEDEM